jgi:lysophospholipase L1-like esterase
MLIYRLNRIRIEEEMEKRAMNYTDLARLLGWSRQLVNYALYHGGKSFAPKIATVLGIEDPNEIITSRKKETRLNIAALIFIAFFAFGCGGAGSEDPSGPALNNVCVAMGDSITNGYGADVPYVATLSKILKKGVINGGVNGAHTDDGAGAIKGIIEQYHPDCITIYYGTNDAGFYDLCWITENLRSMVRMAKESGALVVIATIQPAFGPWAWRNESMRQVSAAVREIAKGEGVACADLERAVCWDESYFIEDGLHPNDKGHLVIAEKFGSALLPVK